MWCRNLYAAILRADYGIVCESLWLLQLHPNLPGYIFIEIPEYIDRCFALLRSVAPSASSAASSTDPDILGGGADSDDEDEWMRRHAKRMSIVESTKKSPEYEHMLRCGPIMQVLDESRPPTPDPTDRRLSKRQWEHTVMNWRHDLQRWTTRMDVDAHTDAVKHPEEKWNDDCLRVAIRCHDIPVRCHRHGPLWALWDGNAMLAPHGMRLVHMASESLSPGRYIVWEPNDTTAQGHFFAARFTSYWIEIQENGETQDRAQP